MRNRCRSRWGSDALKASAQIIIEGTGPAAVAEFMRRVAREPWIPPDLVRPQLMPIGHAAARSISLSVRNRNVVVITNLAERIGASAQLEQWRMCCRIFSTARRSFFRSVTVPLTRPSPSDSQSR